MPSYVFLVFIATWLLLAVTGYFIFFRFGDARLKRRLWPVCIVIISVLFLGFTYFLGVNTNAFYILMPAVILIGILNVRSVNFCDGCGKMVSVQSSLNMERCPACRRESSGKS